MSTVYSNLETLNSRHKEILRRVVRGEKNVEIADALGLHVMTISMLTRSPVFREEVAKLQGKIEERYIDKASEPLKGPGDEARKILEQAQPDAASAITELLMSENERIRLSAAQDILERNGLGRVSLTGQAPTNSITLQIEQTNNIIQTLKEIGTDLGLGQLLEAPGLEDREVERTLNIKSLLPS